MNCGDEYLTKSSVLTRLMYRQLCRKIDIKVKFCCVEALPDNCRCRAGDDSSPDIGAATGGEVWGNVHQPRVDVDLGGWGMKKKEWERRIDGLV